MTQNLKKVHSQKVVISSTFFDQTEKLSISIQLPAKLRLFSKNWGKRRARDMSVIILLRFNFKIWIILAPLSKHTYVCGLQICLIINSMKCALQIEPDLIQRLMIKVKDWCQFVKDHCQWFFKSKTSSFNKIVMLN